MVASHPSYDHVHRAPGQLPRAARTDSHQVTSGYAVGMAGRLPQVWVFLTTWSSRWPLAAPPVCEGRKSPPTAYTRPYPRVSRRHAIGVTRGGDPGSRGWNGDTGREWVADSIRRLASCDDLAVGPAEGPDDVAGRAARPGLGGVVPRPGLSGRLGALARVTVLSAPAGSGKTVLLRSWIGELVNAFLLEATARDALGDPAAAGPALDRALDAAEPDLILFPFLIHPAPGLLERHARNCVRHAALVSEILDLLPGEYGKAGVHGEMASSRARADVGGSALRLLEPLSWSEIRVLRYMPTNLSTPEIARELSLSVHTIRTHIRHLFAKLGAHRRTEAVARAHALGVLASSPSRRSW
jgi:DNA-binding CsgD family transcriptional regulator